MRVSLGATRVENDRFQGDRASDDGEVLAWKRVKAEGRATHDGVETRFEVVLDMRARLLRVVARGEGPTARRIAEALVHEMGDFTLTPIRRVVAPRETPAAERGSEWVVDDAFHVAGLLHRLRELGEFEARDAPPVPIPARAPLRAVVDSVAHNLDVLPGWHELARTWANDPWIHDRPRFDAVPWHASRARLEALLDDDETLLELARFFADVDELAHATRALLAEDAAANDLMLDEAKAARARILHVAERTERRGRELLRRLARTYEGANENASR